MTDNDTSFMTVGSIDGAEKDVFAFSSREAQYVTVVVVPENGLSDFDLEIADASGRTIARSTSDGRQVLSFFGVANAGHYIDFAQLRVAAGEKLQAKVTAKTVNRAFPTYRLIVTGSTKYVSPSDIEGPHQVAR
jgi:hypothetical protein